MKNFYEILETVPLFYKCLFKFLTVKFMEHQFTDFYFVPNILSPASPSPG